MNMLKRKFFNLGATGRITICLLYDPEIGSYSRGISVCSPQDMNDLAQGRAKAEGRAMQALVNESSKAEGIICRPEVIDILKEEGVYPLFVGMHRGEFLPTLFPVELAVIHRWISNKK